MHDYDQYLRDLAEEINCEIRWVDVPHGMMYVEFGYIETPSIGSTMLTRQQEFAIGLHELGHHALGHTQGRPPKSDETFYFDNGVLKSEAEAWSFALDHFDARREEIESETRSFMGNYCLGSYASGATFHGDRPTRLTNGDRGHVLFVYDKPDSYFWAVQNRITGV